MGDFFQNFVAFLEYLNFIIGVSGAPKYTAFWLKMFLRQEYQKISYRNQFCACISIKKREVIKLLG